MSARADQLRLAATLAGGAAAGTVAALAVGRRVLRARRPAGAAGGGLAALDPGRSREVRAEDGTALHVEEVGDQGAMTTVVFVHGWTLDQRSWHFQRRDLAGPGRRLVFPDLRGHGRSGRPADLASCTIEWFARDLFRVLEECADEAPVVLVGHSMGGMTLMALADAHPELFAPGGRVRAVALLSTSAGQTARVTLGLPAVLGRVVARAQPGLARGLNRFGDRLERRRPTKGELVSALVRRMSFGGSVSPEVVELMESMIARCPVPVIGACADEVLRHDKLAALPALKPVATLVLVGGADVLTPVDHSRTIAAELPDSELVVVPGAGHVVQLERPSEVSDHLARLLGRAGAAARSG